MASAMRSLYDPVGLLASSLTTTYDLRHVRPDEVPKSDRRCVPDRLQEAEGDRHPRSLCGTAARDAKLLLRLRHLREDPGLEGIEARPDALRGVADRGQLALQGADLLHLLADAPQREGDGARVDLDLALVERGQRQQAGGAGGRPRPRRGRGAPGGGAGRAPPPGGGG